MREIKFRGQVKYNGGHYFSGEWVYGDLLRDRKGDWFIIDCTEDGYSNITYNKVLVKPETVGQYTGLTDKNGVEIYEGDILSVMEEASREDSFIYYKTPVIWEEGSFVVQDETGDFNTFLASLFDPNKRSPTIEYEIIGNIHEPKPSSQQ